MHPRKPHDSGLLVLDATEGEGEGPREKDVSFLSRSKILQSAYPETAPTVTIEAPKSRRKKC
jgi:hypothetical protein